jgi:hypothetical protein
VLFESYPDPIGLPPDDATGKWNIVSFEDEVKTLWDILSAINLNRRTRNTHIADQAIRRLVSELNHPRHQYGSARSRASFHKNFFASKLMGREYAFPV